MSARRVLAVAAVAAALGCRRAPPPDLSLDPAQLLEQVRGAQRKVVRVQGRARVQIDSPGLSGTVDEFAAAEKPDRVHLETFDFFGNVAAVLVADGQRFALLDAREKVFYRGAPTPENISRLLPIVIPAEELAILLCGSAPLLPGTPAAAEVRDGQVLLTIAAGDTGQRLAIGERAAVESSRVRRLERLPDGRTAEVAPAYDLEFGFFRHREGVRFPSELSLVAPSARVRLTLTWKSDVEVNGPAAPGLFELSPPRGVRIVDLP